MAPYKRPSPEELGTKPPDMKKLRRASRFGPPVADEQYGPTEVPYEFGEQTQEPYERAFDPIAEQFMRTTEQKQKETEFELHNIEQKYARPRQPTRFNVPPTEGNHQRMFRHWI